ncbi:MAG: hypothetical protein GTN53_23000 [Candidatus Aminicenantes bacterium]|nr:hypothetical protein [Candidatus Aminicenantes bacterium]NIQ69372.1 hypothetical protein [Candidatus Aminicenantes bacterium]NIT25373.1 hypothetical protein [Candidatus Aminicenantes bacterium]
MIPGKFSGALLVSLIVLLVLAFFGSPVFESGGVETVEIVELRQADKADQADAQGAHFFNYTMIVNEIRFVSKNESRQIENAIYLSGSIAAELKNRMKANRRRLDANKFIFLV